MAAAATQEAPEIPLIGEAPPSPAGPLEAHEPLALPPARELPRLLQTLRFGMRPMSFNLSARRELGDVWQVQLMSRAGQFVVTSHPDHVESLFKAKPEEAPSLTGESPLRPILGPNSVLTSVGERHMRQRKLLLPPFHGEAVERYMQEGSSGSRARPRAAAWRAASTRPFAASRASRRIPRGSSSNCATSVAKRRGG